MPPKRKQCGDDPPPQSWPRHSSVSCSLGSIVQSGDVKDRILSFVHNSHLINVRTRHLLHMFLVTKATSTNFPQITWKLYEDAVKAVCERVPNKKNKQEVPPSELQLFYAGHFRRIVDAAGDTRQVDGKNMDQAFKYMGTRWATNVCTNMQEHFQKHLTKWLSVMYGETTWLPNERKSLRRQMQRLSNSIFYDADMVLFDDDELKQHLLSFLPDLNGEKLVRVLEKDPLRFVQAALLMQREVAQVGRKTLAVLPSPSCNIPGFVQIDTVLAIKFLLSDEDVAVIEFGRKTKINRGIMLNKPDDFKQEVWWCILKTNKTLFRRHTQGLAFDGSLFTDGVDASILLKGRSSTPPCTSKEVYITDVLHPPDNSKRIVAIDPNMRDLLYMSALGQKNIKDVRKSSDLVKMRYTAMQRRFETGSKEHRKIREKLTSTFRAEDGRSAQEILSGLPRKYCASFEELVQSITAHIKASVLLEALYINKKWRKMKMHFKFRTQKSEANLVKNFAEKFGSPDTVTIAFGDCSRGAYHMRHHAPQKNKGFRKVFKKHGYDVYLINEFRTSKSCFGCGQGECEPFLWHEKSPRPYRNENGNIPTKCHGLVMCNHCTRKWNRDVLATVNMLDAAYCAVVGEDRPARLRRQEQIPGPEEEPLPLLPPNLANEQQVGS